MISTPGGASAGPTLLYRGRSVLADSAEMSGFGGRAVALHAVTERPSGDCLIFPDKPAPPLSAFWERDAEAWWPAWGFDFVPIPRRSVQVTVSRSCLLVERPSSRAGRGRQSQSGGPLGRGPGPINKKTPERHDS